MKIYFVCIIALSLYLVQADESTGFGQYEEGLQKAPLQDWEQVQGVSEKPVTSDVPSEGPLLDALEMEFIESDSSMSGFKKAAAVKKTKKKAAKKKTKKKAAKKKGKKKGKKNAAAKKAAKKKKRLRKEKKLAKKEADAAEVSWSKKEQKFRKVARGLNRKQRVLARRIERDVKHVQKKHLQITAHDLLRMHKLTKLEKVAMAKSAAFQVRMKAIQKKMANEDAKAKAKSAARLKKYQTDVAKYHKALETAKKEHETLALSVQKANKHLLVEQKKLGVQYKEKTAKLDVNDQKDNKKFDEEARQAQKKFSKMFKDNAERSSAARAAIVQSIKDAKKEAAQKVNRINTRISKEQAAKKKTDIEYDKKVIADRIALKHARDATAEKFAKKAMIADRNFHRQMQEAGQKKEKARRAAFAERAAKRNVKIDDKKDEKETKASIRADGGIKECALDGSECQTPDGKCHKTSTKGPYMAEDLVSCSKVKAKDDADAGVAWAGIEPPLPPEKCPPPTIECLHAENSCKANKGCNLARGMGPLKGSIHVGCQEGKKELELWFDFKAACCDKTMIGFADNIPMFKMQVYNTADYIQSSLKSTKFTNNHGAGSVCHMVKSLVAGVEAGLDEHDQDLEKRPKWNKPGTINPKSKKKIHKMKLKHVNIYRFVHPKGKTKAAKKIIKTSEVELMQAIPMWVSNEEDLEEFLQDQKRKGAHIVRKENGKLVKKKTTTKKKARKKHSKDGTEMSLVQMGVSVDHSLDRKRWDLKKMLFVYGKGRLWEGKGVKGEAKAWLKKKISRSGQSDPTSLLRAGGELEKKYRSAEWYFKRAVEAVKRHDRVRARVWMRRANRSWSRTSARSAVKNKINAEDRAHALAEIGGPPAPRQPHAIGHGYTLYKKCGWANGGTAWNYRLANLSECAEMCKNEPGGNSKYMTWKSKFKICKCSNQNDMDAKGAGTYKPVPFNQCEGNVWVAKASTKRVAPFADKKLDHTAHFMKLDPTKPRKTVEVDAAEGIPEGENLKKARAKGALMQSDFKLYKQCAWANGGTAWNYRLKTLQECSASCKNGPAGKTKYMTWKPKYKICKCSKQSDMDKLGTGVYKKKPIAQCEGNVWVRVK